MTVTMGRGVGRGVGRRRRRRWKRECMGGGGKRVQSDHNDEPINL